MEENDQRQLNEEKEDSQIALAGHTRVEGRSTSDHQNDSSSGKRGSSDDWLEEAIKNVMNRDLGERLQPEKWRLLHSNAYSEAHEVDLGNGHSLQLHKLLA